MLTHLTELIDSLSSRHINTERVSLFGAQSLASDAQLIDSEKCARQLSQKAGMCMGLCSEDRGPIKKDQCHDGNGAGTGLSKPGVILEINLNGRRNSDK